MQYCVNLPAMQMYTIRMGVHFARQLSPTSKKHMTLAGDFARCRKLSGKMNSCSPFDWQLSLCVAFAPGTYALLWYVKKTLLMTGLLDVCMP